MDMSGLLLYLGLWDFASVHTQQFARAAWNKKSFSLVVWPNVIPGTQYFTEGFELFDNFLGS